MVERHRVRPPAIRPLSADERELMENIVFEGGAVLRSAGLEAIPPAFPFAHHHARHRSILPGNRKLRHRDVALLLNQWAALHPGFVERYAWQAIIGAAEYLFDGPVPDGLLSPAAEWAVGQPFADWAKSISRIG